MRPPPTKVPHRVLFQMGVEIKKTHHGINKENSSHDENIPPNDKADKAHYFFHIVIFIFLKRERYKIKLVLHLHTHKLNLYFKKSDG